jgi:predicted nucleotidyltransferase
LNDFELTLLRLDEFCNKNSIDYALIGGLAVITYGYARTTKDIDITVLCKLEDMREVHEKFVGGYLPLQENSLEFFSRYFVLPIKDNVTNVKIDVAAGLTVFDDTIISRRKRTTLGEAELYICSLEDLIIYKLFATRYQDLADVQELINRNKTSLDKKYLFETAEKFRELEREDIIENLNKLLQDVS